MPPVVLNLAGYSIASTGTAIIDNESLTIRDTVGGGSVSSLKLAGNYIIDKTVLEGGTFGVVKIPTNSVRLYITGGTYNTVDFQRGMVEISGGVFNEKITYNTDIYAFNCTVTGGTFATANKAFLDANLGTDCTYTEAGGIYTVTQATGVARVDGVLYETIQDAIDAIGYSGTIVLDKSFAIDSETYTIPENKVITLNINGKKLTVTDNKDAKTCYELFYNYGTLIVDGNGTIELTSTSNDTVWAKSSTIFHNRGGLLTITNGTFKHLGGTCMAFVVDNSGNHYGDATANINGGTITGTVTILTADGAAADYTITADGLYAEVPAVPYVAKVGETSYTSVIEALLAAVESGAAKVELLADSREVMPTDVELILNADLEIVSATGEAVSAKFYNEGTTFDFIFNSNNNNTLTIGENVTFQLEDRIIWAGYYGNNVDVVVNGTLAGYQIWHGADTTVNATGTLMTTGEALVMRRGATLTVDGGKVDANYFNILAGNIFAENGATIDSGAFWIANTGSYAGEGNVSINLWDSTLTSSGNLKVASSHDAGVSIDIYNSTAAFNDFDGYGACQLDANTTLSVDGEDSSLTVKNLVNNGTIEVYDSGDMTVTGTLTNDASVSVEDGSALTGAVVLASTEATVTGPAGMNVTTTVTDGEVSFVGGSYGVAVPTELPEATVAELGSTVITDYDVYNGKSLVDGDGTPLGMQITMQFTAQDSAEEAANSYYGDYTTDFFITIDGLANGSVVADGCYLVGHYGEFGWVKVPLDGMTIEEGVYPVISSTGLDFSYEEICTSVKEFKCGIFFSEEVLEANPNLTVGLELGLAENLEKAQNAEFTPVQEEPYTYTAEELKAGTPKLPEATVENLGKITVGEGDYADVDSYYVYDLLGNQDQKLTTKEGSFDLQMAMQFIAKDDAESAAANAYGEYTTDFYITIEGMEGDSFVGDGCYLAGYYPSFKEWVVIPLDGFTVENGKAYPVISSAGFDFSYVDICTTVENFICGIYLSEDVLAANPNLTVGLELGLSETFEDAQAAKFITVDEYTYTAEELKSEPAVAEVDGTKYATLQEAIDAADGKTVTLLTDIALAEGITVAAGKTVTLELNGYTVSRNTEAAVSSAAITNNGSLTIQDSVGGGKVTAFAANPDTAAIPYYASNTITNCGVLTLKSGTIENSTGNDARAAYPIDNNSTSRDAIVNIEGGTVIGRGAIRAFANSTTNKNEVNISDGTVSGTSYAVWVQNPSDGSTANTKEVKAALNVTGGTVDKLLLEPSENITASVTGGTVKQIAIWQEDTVNTERNPSGFVTGGTFLSDVTEFCAEGYTCEDNGDGTYGIEEVELWNVAGTTVNLGTSLGIRFFFAKANFEEGTDYYAMITKEYANRDDVVETIPMANWETSGAYYTTLFNDIPAKEMTDNVTIQIFKADGTAVSNPATESIQSYATRMLNNPNQAQKAKIAVVDMLNYGAAAQNEFGYNTENLANSLLTDEQASWATESATYEIAAEGDRVYGVGSMIALESNVYLRLVFANVDTETMYGIVTYNDYKDRPQTVRIEGSDFKSVGSNYYAADVLTMVVADARQQVTCTLYNANGEAIGYAIDSIESNLARGVNNGTISIVMAEGLLKFADSAKAYLTNS